MQSHAQLGHGTPAGDIETIVKWQEKRYFCGL